jgi:hypothetical protein
MSQSNIQDLINSLRIINPTGTTEVITDADYLDVVDINGGMNLTTSFQDVKYNFQKKLAPAYQHNSGEAEIEFLQDGTYVMIARCTTTVSTGTARSDSSMQLVYDDGTTGFTYLLGTTGHMYNRDEDEGTDTATIATVITATIGDKIKMQVKQDGGSSTLQTVADGSSFLIFNTQGQKGADGEVTIKNEGVAVPNAPHTKINFKGTSVGLEDVGNGQVDVEFDIYDELPSLQIRRDSGYTVSTGWTDLEFNLTDLETASHVIEHNDTFPERIDIKTGGTYLINYSSSIDNLGESRVYKNGNTLISGSYKEAGYDSVIEANFDLSNQCLAQLQFDDYLTFQIRTTTSDTTILNNTHFNISKLDGVKGLPGEQGPQGEIGSANFAWSKTSANGIILNSFNLSCSKGGTGIYNYLFSDSNPLDNNYVITGQHYSTTTDTNIFISNVTTNGFTITVGEGDNGGSPDIPTDTIHSIVITGPALTSNTAFTYSRAEADALFTTENQVRSYTHQKTYSLVTGASYTLDPDNDEVILVNTLQSSGCTLNLPNSNTINNNGKLWEYWIYKNSTDFNDITIQLSGQTFPLGHSKHILRYAEEFLHLGGSFLGGWSKISTLKIVDSLVRNSNWASTNFSTASAVPFESNEVNDNDEILLWSGTTQIKCLVPTRVDVSFIVDIDSTGGATWNATVEIRKNGATINTTQMITGNYGGEDQSISCPPLPVEVQSGDYLELYIQQNSLTGNLINAVMTVSTII